MNKTIEEAAKEFADREYEIGQVDWDPFYKGYYHGMKDLFAQPLRDRLTAEEKERVRKAYKAMSDYGKEKGVECAQCANDYALNWIEKGDNP